MRSRNSSVNFHPLFSHYDLGKTVAVELLDGFNVRLRFSNGEVRELDLERYLHGPIFEPLRKDPDLFRRMHIEGGTIAWPNGADIAPECRQNAAAKLRNGQRVQGADGPLVLRADLSEKEALAHASIGARERVFTLNCRSNSPC